MSQELSTRPSEAPGSEPARLSRAQMNVIFVTILLGMLLSALDQTIVSTALPTIVGDLGGAGHMSWVVTAYMLAETISSVLAGKFGDLFGRKRVFQISVLIFIVGSFFCGFAEDMTTLIIFRAVQGIGGGGLAVTATALIGEVIPLRERGSYQGALGAVFGVTTVLGPLLGGLFTDHLSWRWAFYVNVPIAIVVIIMAARTIPGSAARNPAEDRLPRRPVRLAGRQRTDPGHVVGRHPVPVGLAYDHRPVRRLPDLAGDLRLGGNAGRRNRSCPCGCSAAGSSRWPRFSVSSSVSR